MMMPGGKTSRVVFGFVLVAIILFINGDIAITTATPGAEFQRMLSGLFNPQWLPITELLEAVLQTVCYALLGVGLAVIGGFLLSLVFDYQLVRIICASLRAVHELFWGLLLIQLFGLQPLSGVLAIALPYTGILAKIYAEIRSEMQQHARPYCPASSSRFSRFIYADWPSIRSEYIHYTLYRFECGLRSGAILGFIGLPTLGFYLESAFMQGYYAEVAALLFVFYGLIVTLPWWGRLRFWPFYLLGALYYLWVDFDWYYSGLSALLFQTVACQQCDLTAWINNWFYPILVEQLLPGVWRTVVVGQIALVLSAVLGLLLYPLISRHFFNPVMRWGGHVVLVVMRSTPELILGFVFLLLWGSSLLPAIAALAIHNGAIIGHLTGRYSDRLQLRPDKPDGVSCYGYEVTPRIFQQFLVYTFYRWEVIMRESALLGILGLHTLGYFIDSAFESFRLDVALLLIVVSALLNIGVDGLGKILREYLHLPKYRVTT